MKILFTLSIIYLSLVNNVWGQLYSTQNGETSFFSETPVESISANNKTVGAFINTSTKEIAISMKMSAFDFPNKLMQEHFNENYMESAKFPVSTFTGKILEAIDFTKNGTYEVTAQGQLTVHGVAQPRDLKGKLIIDNQKIYLTSNFEVKLVNHKIDVPKLVFVKIAEIISVKSKYTFTPYVKK